MTYFVNSDGVFKYSLRANDGIDVAEIAETYGGGGHANAAGFSSSVPVWSEIQEGL